MLFLLFVNLTYAPRDLPETDSIFLKSGKVTPQRSAESDNNIYIMQFIGPVKQEWKDELSEIGVKFYSYIPENAFLAKIPASKFDAVVSRDFVDRILDYKPEYKTEKKIKPSKAYSLKHSKIISLDILAFEDDDLVSELENLGADIIYNNKRKLRIKIQESKISQIAQLNNIEWIEFSPIYKLANNKAAVVVGANYSWSSLGLNGSGQIIGIADSGLDTGVDDNNVAGDIHLDFDNRVNAIYYWDCSIYGSSCTSANDTNGHGTHVAGSVLGNGTCSDGGIKGMAYAAQLVFQSVGNDSGSNTVFPPLDLNDLFQQAETANATIHSDSWGGSDNSYTSDSQEVDEFIWNNKNFTIFFAAGNDGSEGVNTVGAPATAKNCITVGNSENDRPPNSASDNINEVYSSSSRGPTEDNRIKPDVVAPGTYILSTKSSLVGTNPLGWGTYDGNYSYSGGTSMSTPIVAGVAALLRQYFIENKSIIPSASLIKAALINGADDMGMNIPNNNSGWGRINLTNSIAPNLPQIISYIDNTSGLSIGENSTYNYGIWSNSTQLKITLVWTDYPGTPAAEKSLVNNLNLIVISPDSTVYYGNYFASPYNSAYDTVNNVEQIRIDNPQAGQYLIKINAYSVPNGPQPFSVVVSGNTDNNSPIVAIIGPTPANATTANTSIYINATSFDSTSNISSCLLDWNNTNQTMTKLGSTNNVSCYINKTITGSGLFNYKVWANDTANNWGVSAVRYFNVTNTVPNITSYTPSAIAVSVAENSSLQFNHTSTDINNDTLSYNWTLNLTTQSTSSSWLYQPNFTAAAEYNVTLLVSDGKSTDLQSWNLTVNNTNRAPVFDSYYPASLNISIAEPNNQTFNISAGDPDSDEIIMKWLFNSTNISDSFNYTFDGNYTSSGDYNITVVINDSSVTAVKTWLLTVNNTNRAPVLNQISNITVNESELVDINSSGEVTATDPENDDLIFNYTSPLNSSGEWKTNYQNSGTYTITITASDGALNDTQQITITVLEIEDEDNDGINDSSDYVSGNSSSINTTLTAITIYINNTATINRTFNGSFAVNITNSSKTILSFDWNFSSSKILNFSSITLNKQSSSSSKGSLLVRGINLTSQNKTKTVYVDNVDAGITTLCIKDAEIQTISNISTSCNVLNETLLTCNGTLQAGKYNCTAVENSMRYKITGLSYSGVVQQCADSDEDGYYVSGCTGGTDCNDNNANINPGASEVCGNSVDDDCDGSTDEGCDTGGGGGGGGAASTDTTGNKETKEWFNIEKDSTKIMDIAKTAIAFRNISFSVRTKLRNVELTVEKLDARPENITKPLNQVYQYIAVNKTNMKEADIKKAEIYFRVEKEWLVNNSIEKDEIILTKYISGRWKEIITKYAEGDENYFYYNSISGTLSYFAITFKKEEKLEKPVIVVNETFKTKAKQEKKQNITEQEEEKEIIPTQQKTRSWFGYMIASFIVVFGITYFYFRFKAKKPKKKR